MTRNWRTFQFSKAVQVNPKTELMRGRAYPFIEMQAIVPGKRSVISNEKRIFEGSGSKFKVGDTLMARITPCLENGKMARFESSDENIGFGSTEFIVIRGREGVTDNDYVYYLTSSDEVRQYAISQMTGTSGRQRVPTDSLDYLEVEIPPLETQREISAILNSIDETTELNRKMNETLEAIAKAIFKSWFVDFDPVHAKAAGKKPVGMDDATAALFPDSFEDSEIGNIPKGWAIEQLGDYVQIIKGKSYKSEDLKESNTALVTLKSFLRGGGYRNDGVKSYIGAYKPEQIVKPGEIIVACTDVTQQADVIGKPALVRSDPKHETLVASLDCVILRPNNKLNIPYLYQLLMSDEYQSHIYGYVSGTTVLHLDKTGITNYKFACPSLQTIQEYNSFAGMLIEHVNNNEKQNAALVSIRDLLLPKLILGEIAVD